MRILLLGINYAPEAIGIAVYTTGVCEDLAKMGHDVRVVAAKPYYPNWRIVEGYKGMWRKTTELGVDITRCPLYVPKNPTGARRLVHHVSFAASALLPMITAAATFRPNMVMTVAPSLIAAPVALAAAKIAGARSWLHIQDFEVEAAFATGLIDTSGRMARLARWVERKIIGLFDHRSSISPEMCAKLESFGIPASQITEFRNWAEVDLIRPLEGPSSYRKKWNISTPHVALYSGNLSNKQGIDILVEAARILIHRRDLTFVICGQGPSRGRLEALAANLDNIQFHDLQPKEQLSDFLGLATVHLLPQLASAADLVLPSKLTNMLASGRPPIVTAAAGTGLAREVEGCGLSVPPEDPTQLASAIEKLLDNRGLRERLAIAARARAEQVWHRGRIIERLVAEIYATDAARSQAGRLNAT